MAPSLAPVAGAAPGSRISWQGGSWYLQGANVPWLNWACDFGCNANGGVSSSAARTTLAGKFSTAHNAGINTIRWWVFEGDPWQVTRNASGAPDSINPAVYADFDAALNLAQQFDLYYDFVLFSGPSVVPAGWLNDATQRQALANALAPLFARYRGNPHVLSWEVFNEPDFDVWNGKVSQASLASTVQAVAASVHANSTAYVTVGMGFADGLPMVVGTGLDYYQAHWYDYMNSGTYCMRCNTYASYQTQFKLDAPLVVGEMYTGSDVDAYQRFQDLYNKGYAGSWPWSLSPEQTTDHMSIDFTAAQTFASQHPDVGPRAAAGGAAATATPTSVPATATATATSVPPTATATATSVPPTATATASATSVRPTATTIPSPSATAVSGSGTSTTFVGTRTLQPSMDSNPTGMAEAFLYSARASGTAGHLSVYLDPASTASQVVIGLYANAATGGKPGALLAQTTLTRPVAGAWNSGPISPVAVVGGQRYWIAVLAPVGSTGAVQFRDIASGGGATQTSAQAALTALPSTWSPGTSFANAPMSAYVSP